MSRLVNFIFEGHPDDPNGARLIEIEDHITRARIDIGSWIEAADDEGIWMLQFRVAERSLPEVYRMPPPPEEEAVNELDSNTYIAEKVAAFEARATEWDDESEAQIGQVLTFPPGLPMTVSGLRAALESEHMFDDDETPGHDPSLESTTPAAIGDPSSRAKQGWTPPVGGVGKL